MSQGNGGLPAHITHNQPRPSAAFNRAVYGIEATPAAVSDGSGQGDQRKIGGPK